MGGEPQPHTPGNPVGWGPLPSPPPSPAPSTLSSSTADCSRVKNDSVRRSRSTADAAQRRQRRRHGGRRVGCGTEPPAPAPGSCSRPERRDEENQRLQRTAPTTHPTAPAWDTTANKRLVQPTLCPPRSYRRPHPAAIHAQSRLEEEGARGGGNVARDDRATATTVQ